MYVHSAGTIQLNSISATAYVPHSAIEYIHGVKAAALLFVASVSKQKPSAHIIAMAHGRDGGTQYINTGASAAPSSTFNLERNTRSVPLEPAPNHNMPLSEYTRRCLRAY